MFEIFNQGWVGSLIGLVGVLIGVIGLILYWRSKIGPRPTCQLRSVRLIGKEEQELPSEVAILFGNMPVPRLTLTRLYFWNSGKETIRGTQIVDDDQLRCVFEPGDEILKAHVAVVTRKVNKMEVSVPPDAKHNAIILFDFLDPQDGVKIELLHTSKELYPRIQGTIRGIPRGITEIARLRPSRFNEFFDRIFRRKDIFIKVVLVFGFASFLLGLLPNEWLFKLNQFFELRPDESGELTVFPLRILFITVGILYTLFPLSFLRSRRKRYPEVLDRDSEEKEEAEQIISANF